MGREVCVAHVDSEDIGQQNVSNVSRGVKEAKVMMARDRARKASQAKGKMVTAKEKAGVARDKHVKHSKGIAIMAGNGVTWKEIASRWQNPRVKVAKNDVE